MNRFLIIFLLIPCSVFGQKMSSDTTGVNTTFDNVYNQKFFSDSLTSSFVILIKKEVKEHKHVTHSEHIYVIDGEALMSLGEVTFPIKKGDVVFIPKNTFHRVETTSKNPLKVLSVQSPMFDGTDRVFK